MAEEAGKAKFERQLADYKTMVILRQKECVSIAELLETSARLLSRRAKQLKIALTILGVIVPCHHVVRRAAHLRRWADTHPI